MRGWLLKSFECDVDDSFEENDEVALVFIGVTSKTFDCDCDLCGLFDPIPIEGTDWDWGGFKRCFLASLLFIGVTVVVKVLRFEEDMMLVVFHQQVQVDQFIIQENIRRVHSQNLWVYVFSPKMSSTKH